MKGSYPWPSRPIVTHLARRGRGVVPQAAGGNPTTWVWAPRAWVTPMVRVPWNAPGDIMKALDGGALGIICPMISTPEQAKRLAALAGEVAKSKNALDVATPSLTEAIAAWEQELAEEGKPAPAAQPLRQLESEPPAGSVRLLYLCSIEAPA